MTAPGPAAAAPTTHRRPRTVASDLREIAIEVIQSRDLIHQLTLRDIRIRYKQALFGFAWALLNPAVVVLAGVTMRFALATYSNQPWVSTDAAPIVLKGLFWSFFVGCINAATPSLLSNLSLVTKIYFPREVLPLGSVLAQTFDSGIGAILAVFVLPLLGVTFSPQLLWVPVLIVLLWILALAAALFLSCANVFFRDVKYLVQIFLTFGIFATPVFLDATALGERGSRVMMLNPVAPILEGARLAVVDHHNLLFPLAAHLVGRPAFLFWRPWYLAYAAGWAFGGLLFSAVLFHRSERRMAEIA